MFIKNVSQFQYFSNSNVEIFFQKMYMKFFLIPHHDTMYFLQKIPYSLFVCWYGWQIKNSFDQQNECNLFDSINFWFILYLAQVMNCIVVFSYFQKLNDWFCPARFFYSYLKNPQIPKHPNIRWRFQTSNCNSIYFIYCFCKFSALQWKIKIREMRKTN